MKKKVAVFLIGALLIQTSTITSFANGETEVEQELYSANQNGAAIDKNTDISAPILEGTEGGTRVIATGVPVQVDNQGHTIAEIIKMEKEMDHYGFGIREVSYETVPSLVNPLSAGSLNKGDVNDSLNTLKIVRFLAGVPYENVQYTENLNNIAQHGAVLLQASNQYTHLPYKPEGVSQNFYDIAYRGCSEANLSYGYDNLSRGILEWIADAGDNNIEHVGHRRWMLNPNNNNFGIGFAGQKISTGGSSWWLETRMSLHVMDSGVGSNFTGYVAWPAVGNFPIQYFDSSWDIDGNNIAYPWSINLGNEYAAPNREEIKVQLTRKTDNKVWTFDKNTPLIECCTSDNGGMQLAVDNDGYGMGKAIIFRPDLASLGEIKEGDVFTVNVSGIKTTSGQPTTLEYAIDFFDLELAMELEELSTHNIKATSSGENKVTLTWSKTGNADGYLIYGQKNGEYGYVGMTTKGTTFTDIKALDNAYNFYWVYPYIQDSEGKRHIGKSGTYVYAKGVIPAITGLKASSVNGGVKLNWNASTDADGYLVYGIVNGEPYGYVGMTTKGTTFTDTKASKTQYNFYWVYPYHLDEAGKRIIGGKPNYVYAKAAPLAVTNLKASSVSGGVKLNWNASTGADGYLVYGIVNGGAYGYVGMTTKGTTYTDTKASKTQYNFYWVYPYYIDGSGKRVIGGKADYIYGKAL